MPRIYEIELRRGTASEWATANPILAAGEPGVELPGGKIKVGNGTNHWNDLPYSGGGVADLTPWTTDIDAASHKLTGLAEIDFASGAVIAGNSAFDFNHPQSVAHDGSHRASFATNWFPIPVDFTQFADAYLEAWGTPGGTVFAVQYIEAQALDGAYAWGDFFVEAGGASNLSTLTLGDNAGSSQFKRDHGVTTLGPMDEVTGPTGVPSVRFTTTAPWNGLPGLVLAKPSTATPAANGVEFTIADGAWSGFANDYGLLDFFVRRTGLVDAQVGFDSYLQHAALSAELLFNLEPTGAEFYLDVNDSKFEQIGFNIEPNLPPYIFAADNGAGTPRLIFHDSTPLLGYHGAQLYASFLSGSPATAFEVTDGTGTHTAALAADASTARVEGIDEYRFSNGTRLVARAAGGARVRDDTSTQGGNAVLQTLWTDGSDLVDSSWSSFRQGPTIADAKNGEMYLEALDAATGHYPFLDMGAQASPGDVFSFFELSDWNSGFAHLQFVHDASLALNYLDSNHLQLLRNTTDLLAFFGTTPTVGQHAAIVNADGTLTDVTSKLNTVLQYLRDIGMVHA